MNAVCFDGVMQDLLGMHRVVAENTVRQFLLIGAVRRATMANRARLGFEPLDQRMVVKPFFAFRFK